ncbi:MAG: hypothetical protein ACE5I3_03170 [Phycisphaerae bacterium]
MYCQRNREIDQVLDPKAMAAKDLLDEGLTWFDRHRSVGEVLVTGALHA